MMSQFKYPEYIEVNEKRYKINTDFRVAIRCNDISMKNDIDTPEKVFATIFLLFGKEALEDIKQEPKLINDFGEKAITYLQCGETNDIKQKKEEPDMDFIQDMPYIEASFMSDYHIDLSDTQMHWWKFYYLISGLSNSEMGNCCVLNRIRSLRTTDLSKIKDVKERNKIKEAKERFALKKQKPQKTFTDEELKAMEEYHKLIEK